MTDCKVVSFLPCIFCIATAFCQISQYNHPPSIMGQERVSMAPGDGVTVTPDLLIIHDIDGPGHATFKVKVSGGKNYTVLGSRVIANEGFKGTLHVPVTVSDGEYTSSPFEMLIFIGEREQSPPEDGQGVFFVSTGGNDRNAGTREKPLRTLDGARVKVRHFIEKKPLPATGITVFFRQGDYYFGDAVVFSEADAGQEGKHVTYRAWPGEQVRFTGAKRIEKEWIQPAPPGITARIRRAGARDSILVVDLENNGITEYGAIDHVGYGVKNAPIPPANIFIDGETMHLARYPNSENFNDIESSKGANTFISRSKAVNRWQNTGDIWVNGPLSKAWEWKKNRISTISQNGQVVMQWKYHSDIQRSEATMFYFNILEELDAPNEFFLDREKGKLYFYPPPGFHENAEVRISQSSEMLVILQGAHHLRFQDIIFEGTRNTAITINGEAYANQFEHCEIRSVGLDGIVINGKNNEVRNTLLHNIGANGIVLGGGDLRSLEPARNLVENCIIRDFSQERKAYNPGLSINGVGQVIRHVELYNGPHMAVKIKGNNHIIEYSDFHRAPLEYTDMLAIYLNTGSNQLNRGTIIRRNKFHDVRSHWKQAAGVYMDNETSGVVVEENYFYDNGADQNGWSTMIHGGADNIIRKNIFVNCSFPFFISTRLNGYADFWFEGRLDRWQQEFAEEASDAHFYHYPELKHYFDDEGDTPEPLVFDYKKQKDKEGEITNYWDRRVPSTNVFVDNLVYNEHPDIFKIPATDPSKALENRGFYAVKNFRLENGKREDNLIHSNNHHIHTLPRFKDYDGRDLALVKHKNMALIEKLPHLPAMRSDRIGTYGHVGVGE